MKRTLMLWTGIAIFLMALIVILSFHLVILSFHLLPHRLSFVKMAKIARATPEAESYLGVAPGTDQYHRCIYLQANLEYLRWQVEFVPTDRFPEGTQGAAGVTISSHRLILVDDSLSWNERYLVLAHEGGHAIGAFLPVGHNEGEVFADAVAYLVDDAADGYAVARHMAQFKGGLRVLHDYEQEIRWVAMVLRGPGR